MSGWERGECGGEESWLQDLSDVLVHNAYLGALPQMEEGVHGERIRGLQCWWQKDQT